MARSDARLTAAEVLQAAADVIGAAAGVLAAAANEDWDAARACDLGEATADAMLDRAAAAASKFGHQLVQGEEQRAKGKGKGKGKDKLRNEDVGKDKGKSKDKGKD